MNGSPGDSSGGSCQFENFSQTTCTETLMNGVEGTQNYCLAEALLATSGQPSESQLVSIAEAGYSVVINLALHDDPRYSLPDEPGSVAALGLRYIHIPVPFSAPTQENLLRFFDAMDECRDKKVWVHCASNMRVPVFIALYRILRQGWDENRAFELMRSVWQPNDLWSSFLSRSLDEGRMAGES